MVIVAIEKSEFGRLNDKRYILPDGISSFPYEHKHLGYLENFKSEISLAAEKIIKSHNNLLRFKQEIL